MISSVNVCSFFVFFSIELVFLYQWTWLLELGSGNIPYIDRYVTPQESAVWMAKYWPNSARAVGKLAEFGQFLQFKRPIPVVTHGKKRIAQRPLSGDWGSGISFTGLLFRPSVNPTAWCVMPTPSFPYLDQFQYILNNIVNIVKDELWYKILIPVNVTPFSSSF